MVVLILFTSFSTKLFFFGIVDVENKTELPSYNKTM